MLTKLVVRNFKVLGDVEIELGQSVVLIGPNNSGKTSALQALGLWEIGKRRWFEKRAGKTLPEQRPGVTINRRDVVSIPVPAADLIWRHLRVRAGVKVNGKQATKNILIDIRVEGITAGQQWECGFEFDYANEESFYCRPLRRNPDDPKDRMPVPEQARDVKVAFLPPMSGLADREFRKEPGEVDWLIGQARTAEVLRNLCLEVSRDEDRWKSLCAHLHRLFGVDIERPRLLENAQITVAYRDPDGPPLDLSASGRGFQQTLLLLCHLYTNPGSVLLLDEPDAHLEILRQRQTYQLLTEVAAEQGCQFVAASHSEVVLNEAADRDVVVAFVGKPHRIDDRGSQLLKALKEIGFEHYYQAEQTGWVLYLEGSTDLAILRAFAATCGHPASQLLERPFFHPVGNQATKAREHFFGLQEAFPALQGIGIFDRDVAVALQQGTALRELAWARREIENYLCSEAVLVRYARGGSSDDLFAFAEAQHREDVMRGCIRELADALQKLEGVSPWSPDLKVTDRFLNRLFDLYFERLNLPNLLRKTDYHVLAGLVEKDEIHPDVIEKLDAIVAIAKSAKPRTE